MPVPLAARGRLSARSVQRLAEEGLNQVKVGVGVVARGVVEDLVEQQLLEVRRAAHVREGDAPGRGGRPPGESGGGSAALTEEPALEERRGLAVGPGGRAGEGALGEDLHLGQLAHGVLDHHLAVLVHVDLEEEHQLAVLLGLLCHGLVDGLERHAVRAGRAVELDDDTHRRLRRQFDDFVDVFLAELTDRRRASQTRQQRRKSHFSLLKKSFLGANRRGSD